MLYPTVQCGASGCMLRFGSVFARAGVVMLKLLDPQSILPPDLRSTMAETENVLKDMESLQAVNRAVEGLPCALMPDGRLGLPTYYKCQAVCQCCCLQLSL
ncbi:TPA: hypothetical protein ACH3X2_009658 [Trebouxia sp. C0005]